MSAACEPVTQVRLRQHDTTQKPGSQPKTCASVRHLRCARVTAFSGKRLIRSGNSKKSIHIVKKSPKSTYYFQFVENVFVHNSFFFAGHVIKCRT